MDLIGQTVIQIRVMGQSLIVVVVLAAAAVRGHHNASSVRIFDLALFVVVFFFTPDALPEVTPHILSVLGLGPALSASSSGWGSLPGNRTRTCRSLINSSL